MRVFHLALPAALTLAAQQAEASLPDPAGTLDFASSAPPDAADIVPNPVPSTPPVDDIFWIHEPAPQLAQATLKNDSQLHPTPAIKSPVIKNPDPGEQTDFDSAAIQWGDLCLGVSLGFGLGLITLLHHRSPVRQMSLQMQLYNLENRSNKAHQIARQLRFRLKASPLHHELNHDPSWCVIKEWVALLWISHSIITANKLPINELSALTQMYGHKQATQIVTDHLKTLIGANYTLMRLLKSKSHVETLFEMLQTKMRDPNAVDAFAEERLRAEIKSAIDASASISTRDVEIILDSFH